MTGNKEPKIVDNTSIDKLLEDYGVIEPVEMEVPDYSYGASQEPLNAGFQVRNIGGGGGKVKTGYSSIPSGYTDFAITGVGFTPKAIQVSVQLGGINWAMAWGYADNIGGTLTQRCTYMYWNGSSISTDNATSRLFRFTNISVGDLVSIDSDGFTVKSDLAATMIWTCFG